MVDKIANKYALLIGGCSYAAEALASFAAYVEENEANTPEGQDLAELATKAAAVLALAARVLDDPTVIKVVATKMAADAGVLDVRTPVDRSAAN